MQGKNYDHINHNDKAVINYMTLSYSLYRIYEDSKLKHLIKPLKF